VIPREGVESRYVNAVGMPVTAVIPREGVERKSSSSHTTTLVPSVIPREGVESPYLVEELEGSRNYGDPERGS